MTSLRLPSLHAEAFVDHPIMVVALRNRSRIARSQFKNGTRGFKPLEANTFMDQCANELPLAYWAYSRGYILTPMESELQKRLRIKDEELQKVKDENRLLREIAVGRAA